MFSYFQPDTPSGDYKIFGSIKGFPIDLTAILVAAHILCMLACTVIIATQPGWIRLFVCSQESLYEGHLWQFITYVFIHDISFERIWFVIGMAMLIWFGRPVESTIGTLSFGIMYAACAVIPVFLLVALSPFLPISSIAGSDVQHFALFVGYSVLFPDTMIFRIIKAKWVALIFLAVDTLAYIARHNWTMLMDLWLSTGFIYGYIRYIHGQGIMMRFMNRFQRRPNLRIYKEQQKSDTDDSIKNENIMDTLLQKISEKGIDSLSAKEKQQLEKARKNMLSKKKH